MSDRKSAKEELISILRAEIERLKGEKSDAMEFAEWLLQNTYMNGTIGYYLMADAKHYTTEQLYDIFK